MTKLIIIRGPSAAGKSTVAKELMRRSDRPTMLVEQDQFRPNFNQTSPQDKLPIWELIEANIITGLQQGYDVIAEGILNVQKPGRIEMLQRIFKAHPTENYIFYMDVSFEETLKRHETRKDKVDHRTEQDMRGWFKLASPVKNFNEVVIPENYSKDETIKKIKEITKT